MRAQPVHDEFQLRLGFELHPRAARISQCANARQRGLIPRVVEHIAEAQRPPVEQVDVRQPVVELVREPEPFRGRGRPASTNPSQTPVDHDP